MTARQTPGLAAFMDAYRPALHAAVAARPTEYALHPTETPAAYADSTATRMEAAFARGTYNHDGRAIRAACKALGIPHTRKAIEAFLTGDAR